MLIARFARNFVFAFFALLIATVPALASPWAEVGDNQLRSDIALLAAAGVINDVTTQWPLPWNAIIDDLKDNALVDQPAAVRAAAQRILARARSGNKAGFSASLYLDGTNQNSVVYGFDGMGRGDGAAQMSLGYNSEDFAARLSVGGFTQNFQGKTTLFMPDESYVATKLDNALIYGGYLSHWWGPGWISALTVSNNARPMPQIGIERLDTSASKSPWLSWLGPWQLEFFVGYLDGPRIQKYTYYNALRFSFQPVQGLEVGLSRTEQLCGEGHPCVPLRSYFYINFNNNYAHVGDANDEFTLDFKYSNAVGNLPFEIYMQLMNELPGPINLTETSHLFGSTVFLPTGGAPVRLTLEYTDSVPTVDLFSFGYVYHGFAYNNGSYPDGMRYRDRTLGFSLDSDSRLLSLQASWTDSSNRFYELGFHHAVISNPNIGSFAAPFYNTVTASPVIVNIGEAKFTMPLRFLKFDLAARLQDDQPRPQRGFLASVEAALRVDL